MREVTYSYVKGEGWVAEAANVLPCPVKLNEHYYFQGNTYLCTTVGDLKNKDVPIYPMGSPPWGSGCTGAVINPVSGWRTRREWWGTLYYDDVWVLVNINDV